MNAHCCCTACKTISDYNTMHACMWHGGGDAKVIILYTARVTFDVLAWDRLPAGNRITPSRISSRNGERGSG